MAPLVEQEASPISVERLCAEVTHALPADGVLVADTGYSGRVEEPGEIAAALKQAIAADGPVVIDVVTALEPRAPEPWSPTR